MKALSPERKLCALQHAYYLSVSLPDSSFLAPFSTTALAILFRPSQFSERAGSWVVPYSTASAHLKLTPSLN